MEIYKFIIDYKEQLKMSTHLATRWLARNICEKNSLKDKLKLHFQKKNHLVVKTSNF